jgi:hypothetical protein
MCIYIYIYTYTYVYIYICIYILRSIYIFIYIYTCIYINISAKNSDPDSLLELLELVVGAAVMCERKATFIQAIFGLDHLSQTVLKGMVEHAMHRMQDYPIEGEGVHDDRGDLESTAVVSGIDLIGEGVAAMDNVGDSSEELIRAREMVRHLQGERSRLLGLVSDLEAGQSALKQEADVMQSQREQIDRDREVSGGERSNKETAAITAINVTLQVRYPICRQIFNSWQSVSSL